MSDNGETGGLSMNENSTFFIVVSGCLLAGVGGIGLIKWSHLSENPPLVRKLGRLACMLSVVGFLLVLIGVSMGIWN